MKVKILDRGDKLSIYDDMMLYFLTEGIAIKPENYLIINPGGGGGGGRPLTLLYTIFYKKGTPFVYLLLTDCTPFTYPV